MSKIPSEKPSLFKRIFDALLPSKDKELPEQITCLLRKDAQQVRSQLENIKAQLLDKGDDDLYPMVTEVIDPMLRKEPNENEYREWIKKAKHWVRLITKEKEEVIEAIIKHVVQKSLDRIDRDIKFLNEYSKQCHKEQELLSPHITKLRALQNPPEIQSLKIAEEWRRFLDTSRAKHLNSALKQIEKQG